MLPNQRNIPTRLLSLTLVLAGSLAWAALLSGTAGVVTAQTAGPGWTYTGNLIFPGGTATLLLNGNVLAVGGTNAELYDPATGAWRATGSLNEPCPGTATVLLNGKVLVAGCGGGTGAELYDPPTGAWTVTGSLNIPRGAFTATLLQNGQVLIVGGDVVDTLDDAGIKSAEIYEPATGMWTVTGSLNRARFSHTATLLQNGNVLVVGGEDGFWPAFQSAELYDPNTGTWRSTGSLNTDRRLHTATILANGKVLVAGGESHGCFDGSGCGFSTVTNTAEIYDPVTGRWSYTGNFSRRSDHTATLLANGQVLVAGGEDFTAVDMFQISNTAELYDPATAKWSSTANLNVRRVRHMATLLQSGRVLVFGTGAARSAQEFDVASRSAELYGSAATPGPNSVQFSSSSYIASEGSPRVDITLTRSGDTSGAASVTFATNDGAGLQNCDMANGMASPRCDYENTMGAVQFAAGQASRTFSVAIVNDSYSEGNETFTVSLTGASGATLDQQSSATVMIMDDDASNGPDPIDSTNFFVRQQYLDFLGREPDPPGFNGWVDTINNCAGDTTQCDRVHVSQQFFQSEEFQSRGYFVYRFYPVAFGRKPDYSEFIPDLARVSGFLDANQLEAGKVAFIADFMARPGFVSTYNSLNNTQYVDALINTAAVNLPNRQALIDGLNNSTMTRAQVLRQIVESSEVSIKYNHQAYAVMEYFGYLRRQPDAFYLDWINVLDQTNDPRGMVRGFVTSAEYRQRFGP